MHQIKVIDFLHLCLQFLHSQIRSVGYILERREGIDIKGKGIMDTYFLNGVSNDFDPGRNKCFANDHETTPQRTQLNRDSLPLINTHRDKPQSMESSTFCSIIQHKCLKYSVFSLNKMLSELCFKSILVLDQITSIVFLGIPIDNNLILISVDCYDSKANSN